MAAKKPRNKVRTVMHEYKQGTLRSGSARGPKVTSRKQAIAIGLSEQRKAGGGPPAPRKRRRKKS
jgi:hypothetical protein